MNVGSDASYVVEPSVAVTVAATKSGHTDASEVTLTLAVNLTAPSSRVYTAPPSLQVGVAIGSLSPSSTSDTDIASYDAAGLPAGLVIAAVTGVISGTPSEAKATETTATVTVTDTGGNTTEEEVTFPVVSKGSQVLSGFSYSSSSVTYGDDEPTVVAPTGAQTPVTYAATPTDVCTVNPGHRSTDHRGAGQLRGDGVGGGGRELRSGGGSDVHGAGAQRGDAVGGAGDDRR